MASGDWQTLVSRISPCLASTAGDSLVIVCVEDRTAGLHERGHGPQTTNSVTVLRVPTAGLPAIEERTQMDVPRRSGLSVAPNPSGSRCVVSTPLTRTGAVLTLWDSQGRLVRTERHARPQNEVITSALPPGVYLIRVNANGQLLETRLVVAR